MSTPIVCPFNAWHELIAGSIEPIRQSIVSIPSIATRFAPLAIAAITVGVGAQARSICPFCTARIASVPVVKSWMRMSAVLPRNFS